MKIVYNKCSSICVNKSRIWGNIDKNHTKRENGMFTMPRCSIFTTWIDIQHFLFFDCAAVVCQCLTRWTMHLWSVQGKLGNDCCHTSPESRLDSIRFFFSFWEWLRNADVYRRNRQGQIEYIPAPASGTFVSFLDNPAQLLFDFTWTNVEIGQVGRISATAPMQSYHRQVKSNFC